jgi:hypothetical protein
MGKTLKYVSEFTFPSANKTDAKGYAQGGPPQMAARPAAQQQALQQRLAQQMVQARAAQQMQQPPGRPMVPPQGSIPAQMPRGPMPGMAPRGPMPGMAKGGMMKPAASPAPKSDMLYSKKENAAKTLLSDGKGAPMPHARGSVNMAKGGKVSMEKWESSKEDMQQDKKLAAKHGMSYEAWEKSPMDKKHDTQQSMKGMAKGGMSKVGKVMGEFKAGELHSGSKSGPVVKSRKQAVAIGMSEARKAAKK